VGLTAELDQLPDQSLADAVAGRLRRAIHAGDLQPGARLVERALAAHFGVSHIPVREAFARLEEEALVVRFPRRGARVAEVSERTLAELSEIRVVLERLVVRRVQAAWSAEAEERLRAIATEMQTAAAAGDVAAVYDLDWRFHETLWRLADHAILLEVVAQMRGRIERFLRVATLALPPDALRAHADEHVALLESIGSGSRTRAERAMERHIGVAAQRIARSAELGHDVEPER
jgi:DNA-binding GntR family transcriptional regulator